MVKNITKNKNIGLAYCQSYEVNSYSKKIIKLKVYPHLNEMSTTVVGRSFLKKYMVDINSIPNVSSVLFKKSYIKKYCTIGTSFKYAGDWFIYINILCKSDIFIEPEFLNYFRSHDATTRAKRNIPEWIRANEELLRIQNLLLSNKVVTGLMYKKNVFKIINNINLFRNIKTYLDTYIRGHTGDLCIYGASPLGALFYSLIKEIYPQLNVKYFIDKKAKNGSFLIENINVFTLDNLIGINNNIPRIFIASIEFYDEITQELKQVNLHEKILNIKSM